MNTPMTPEDLMTQIRSKIAERAVLAENSITHAKAINKNREDRAALSFEIKALVPQWAESKRVLRASEKAVVAPKPKAEKKSMKPAEVHLEAGA